MATAIFLVVGTSTVGLITSSIDAHSVSHMSSLAQEAAQTQIEKVRALPYANVGTTNGNPTGTVTATQAASALGFANFNATVNTAIKYVADGVPSAYNQLTNYKQITVTVVANTNSRQLAQDVTYIAPPTQADQGNISQASIKVFPYLSGNESASSPGRPWKLRRLRSGKLNTCGPSGIVRGAIWIWLAANAGS